MSVVQKPWQCDSAYRAARQKDEAKFHPVPGLDTCGWHPHLEE